MKRFAVLFLPALLVGCGSNTAAPGPQAHTPPAVSTAAYVHFGDSITCGNYASDAAHTYTGIMDATVVGMSVNHCDQGALSIDLSPFLYRNRGGQGVGDTSTLMIGTNDVWVCGMDCLENYTRALTGMSALLALPPSDQIGARRMTQSGVWVADDDIAGGLGVSTSAQGSFLEFKVSAPVAGRHVFIAWKGTDGSAAGGTILIDGVEAGAVTTAGSAPVLTPHGTHSAVFAAAFPLSTAGAHTVRIAYTGQGSFTLEWAGVNTQACVSAGTPHLILGTVPKEYKDHDDGTRAFSDAVTEIASLLRADGMFVELADTHGALTPDDFYDQWVHPNDAGHAKLAAAFLHPAVPPAVPGPVPVP